MLWEELFHKYPHLKRESSQRHQWRLSNKSASMPTNVSVQPVITGPSRPKYALCSVNFQSLNLLSLLMSHSEWKRDSCLILRLKKSNWFVEVKNCASSAAMSKFKKNLLSRTCCHDPITVFSCCFTGSIGIKTPHTERWLSSLRRDAGENATNLLIPIF